MMRGADVSIGVGHRGTGLFHSFPEPHDYTASRDHVRGAIQDRFGLPPDFHMYLTIDVSVWYRYARYQAADACVDASERQSETDTERETTAHAC